MTVIFSIDLGVEGCYHILPQILLNILSNRYNLSHFVSYFSAAIQLFFYLTSMDYTIAKAIIVFLHQANDCLAAVKGICHNCTESVFLMDFSCVEATIRLLTINV